MRNSFASQCQIHHKCRALLAWNRTYSTFGHLIIVKELFLFSLLSAADGVYRFYSVWMSAFCLVRSAQHEYIEIAIQANNE